MATNATQLAKTGKFSLKSVKQPKDLGAVLLKLLASPTIADKHWVFRQYDHQVRTNTLLKPGSDAAEPDQPVMEMHAVPRDEVLALIAELVLKAAGTRNVHRSNMLMGFPYGRDFVYDEMQLTGPGAEGEARAPGHFASIGSSTSRCGAGKSEKIA